MALRLSGFCFTVTTAQQQRRIDRINMVPVPLRSEQAILHPSHG